MEVTELGNQGKPAMSERTTPGSAFFANVTLWHLGVTATRQWRTSDPLSRCPPVSQ